MRSRSLAALALASILRATPAGAGVLERIVAVVDGRPVLLSEVRVLEQVRGVPEATAISALVDERLMFQEASRLPQASLTPEDEERAYQGLVARFGGPKGLASESDLRRLARREAIVLKYVDFRFRVQVRVGDEDVKKAYDAAYGGEASPPPLDSVAEALRERLVRAGLDERVEAWVKELRASAVIVSAPPLQGVP